MNLSVAAIGMEIALLRRFPPRPNTLLLAFYEDGFIYGVQYM
jgi:hypothetical protein